MLHIPPITHFYSLLFPLSSNNSFLLSLFPMHLIDGMLLPSRLFFYRYIMLRCVLYATRPVLAVCRSATNASSAPSHKLSSFSARGVYLANPTNQNGANPAFAPTLNPSIRRAYSASAGDIQDVDVEDFLTIDKDSYNLIDVRTQPEWDEDHMEGAIHVPLDVIMNNEADLDMLRSKPCILYCKAGIRSNMACNVLRQHGVRAVNLNGGLTAIRAAE